MIKSVNEKKKKKQKSLFLPFILIKSTGGYITFEDSKWFHGKKFKLILLLIFNKLRRKKVLNIGKFKSKFYHQTSLTFFSKRDKSYIFLSNHQPFLTFFLISRIIFLLVQQQYYLQNNSQIYSESSPFSTMNQDKNRLIESEGKVEDFFYLSSPLFRWWLMEGVMSHMLLLVTSTASCKSLKFRRISRFKLLI